MKSCVLAVVAIALLVRVADLAGVELVGVALAQGFDVHGYVEPCTLANVEETHLECELCSVSSSSPSTCGERLGERGFEKRCRTHGGHEWQEVWCLDLRKRRAKTYNFALGALALLAASATAFVYFRRARGKRT